jgi:hypothetical protein
MRSVAIRKRDGRVRHILAVSQAERVAFREILREHANENRDDLEHAHGFIRGRNTYTCALPHVGAFATISMDLRDFFDSCTEEMCRMWIRRDLVEKICLPLPERDGNRALRQGLPTSPFFSNVCAGPLDKAICKIFKKLNLRFAYTRYADDLSISLWEPQTLDALRGFAAKITQAVRRCGFFVNERKTRFQFASSGRREIVGMMVDHTGVYPSRKLRKKLRAAEHQFRLGVDNKNSLSGLRSAVAVRAPLTPQERLEKDDLREERTPIPTEEVLIPDIERYWSKFYNKTRRWSARKKPTFKYARYEKLISPRRLINGARVVTSQVDFIGMGLVHYVGSEKMSCLSPRGSNHRSVLGWISHPGVALCVIRKRQTVIRGLKLWSLAARAIIFLLQDGRIVWGKIYADNERCKLRLEEAMTAAGYQPAVAGMGNVAGVACPTEHYDVKPYLDMGVWCKTCYAWMFF